MGQLKGYISSFQSFGTLDGPGIRFVVFMQGCNLRCVCCHNPETWPKFSSATYSPQEVFDNLWSYKEYFKDTGGITVSGGEPLLQSDFVYELFRLCREAGINTCLDTSGSILNSSVEKLLTVTDRVLLDLKYTDEKNYLSYVGCSLKRVMNFLSCLNEKNIVTTIRQVIIPGLNDTFDQIKKLQKITEKYSCIDKIELLPFKNLCQEKYDSLNIDFPLRGTKALSLKRLKEFQDSLK